jgi:hypothetical protein
MMHWPMGVRTKSQQTLPGAAAACSCCWVAAGCSSLMSRCIPANPAAINPFRLPGLSQLVVSPQSLELRLRCHPVCIALHICCWAARLGVDTLGADPDAALDI